MSGIMSRPAIPPGILANISQTNLGEACQGVLRAAYIPTRRSQSYRVFYEGQPLWLLKNQTIYKRRTTAKAAVIIWLQVSLGDIVNDDNCRSMTRDLRNPIVNLPERLGVNYFSEVRGVITQHVDAMLDRGELTIEEVHE